MTSSLPAGTVTFLFTDIEGSTTLAQSHRDVWESLRLRHNVILRGAMEANGGLVFEIIGDAFCVAFHTALEALKAALDAQQQLQAEDWGETSIRVRMGINTGTAQPAVNADGSAGYTGYSTLARTQRVMSTAYGQQILVSNASADLLLDDLPAGVSLRDMQQHRLKGLLNLEHLWQVVAPNLQQNFPALQTLNSIPNNLPIQLTSFIGREKEIDRIKNLVEHHRLVTLTGSGGVGKTRHSLQVSAELLDQFPDGVWLVEMAPVSVPGLVLQAVANVLGLREDQGRPLMDALQDYLRSKSAFLVMDSCEHLLEACAQLADALLHACPNLRILASSREALGIAGEVAYRVPSLALADPEHLPALESLTQYDSVRLFIERALAVQPDFAVTNENAPAVAQICARLDGIPLAIELAAARVKGLSVEQISQRLDDRFRLLTGGSRTALPRHQTLRALIEWSYELLLEPERTLLRRLAIFVGDWTLEAAEAVCADDTARPSPRSKERSARAHIRQVIDKPDVLELLLRLVDKSLVVAEEHTGQARYHMLETIRQLAREKLSESGEEAVLQARHLGFYLSFSEQAEAKLQGAESLIWLHQLGAEYENLRAALAWAREHREAQPPMRLARATEQLGDAKAELGVGTQAIKYYQEALDLWRSVEGADRMNEARLYGKIMRRVANLRWHVDAVQYDSLLKLAATSNISLAAAMESLKDQPPSLEQSRLLSTLSVYAADVSVPADRDLAEQYARRALEIAEKLDSPADMSAALDALATVYYRRGLLRKSSEILQQRLLVVSDTRARAGALIGACDMLDAIGEPAAALPQLLEAQTLAAQMQDAEREMTALRLRILTLLRLDRWDEILALDDQFRDMARQHPQEQVGLLCFEASLIGSVHALRGEWELARRGREEANAIMTEHVGAVEGWKPAQHY